MKGTSAKVNATQSSCDHSFSLSTWTALWTKFSENISGSVSKRTGGKGNEFAEYFRRNVCNRQVL